MPGSSFRAQHVYPECVQFKKKKTYFPITEEMINQMTQDADVLPLYEVQMAEYQLSKNSSLCTNKMLNCRWREYLSQYNTIVRQPFKFPLHSDLHFFNNLVRYRPQDSVGNKTDTRRHFFQGPRCDHLGQIPLAHDTQFRVPNNKLKLPLKKKLAKN